MIGAVALRPAAELSPLELLDPGELPLGDAFGPDHLVVDDPDTVLADRAHGQFRLGGQADLADQDDVQRGIQRPGDLIGHRDPPAGQAEHHAARSPHYRRLAGQQAGQPPPGVRAIEEGHRGTPVQVWSSDVSSRRVRTASSPRPNSPATKSVTPASARSASWASTVASSPTRATSAGPAAPSRSSMAR